MKSSLMKPWKIKRQFIEKVVIYNKVGSEYRDIANTLNEYIATTSNKLSSGMPGNSNRKMYFGNPNMSNMCLVKLM